MHMLSPLFILSYNKDNKPNCEIETLLTSLSKNLIIPQVPWLPES